MSRLLQFHRDDRGLEALQVVMIIAIAALVLALVKLFWSDVKNWVTPLVANIVDWKN
ncbi:MAG: hypothetical protein MUF18_04065 [Fimbriiglobus sp.]|nr:hypothetical protein [Fimbriiglobus sp.]